MYTHIPCLEWFLSVLFNYSTEIIVVITENFVNIFHKLSMLNSTESATPLFSVGQRLVLTFTYVSGYSFPYTDTFFLVRYIKVSFYLNTLSA